MENCLSFLQRSIPEHGSPENPHRKSAEKEARGSDSGASDTSSGSEGDAGDSNQELVEYVDEFGRRRKGNQSGSFQGRETQSEYKRMLLRKKSASQPGQQCVRKSSMEIQCGTKPSIWMRSSRENGEYCEEERSIC